MKYVKTLGLATALAAALMAVVGVSASSATVLCLNNASTTTCSEPAKEGDTFTTNLAPGTKGKLVTSFKTIECESSSLGAKVTNGGGSSATVKAAIETLTYGGCNCTLAVLKKGTLEVHYISGTDNGTMTVDGTELTTSCSTIFGTVHCIYVAENKHFGTFVGSSEAKLKESGLDISRLSTNGLCDEKAELTAEYVGEGPTYVTLG